MKIATSLADAMALYPGWELYKDSETEIRCYAPGEIQRPEPPPEVPVVSMRAFRLALSQMGWRQEVAEFLTTAPIEVVDSFETAPRVARYDPMVLGATAALKKTDAQADQLFVVAKEIEAAL